MCTYGSKYRRGITASRPVSRCCTGFRGTSVAGNGGPQSGYPPPLSLPDAFAMLTPGCGFQVHAPAPRDGDGVLPPLTTLLALYNLSFPGYRWAPVLPATRRRRSSTKSSTTSAPSAAPGQGVVRGSGRDTGARSTREGDGTRVAEEHSLGSVMDRLG